MSLSRKSRKPILLAAAAVVSLLVILNGISFLTENPFSSQRGFSEPSYVSNPTGDIVLVIDDSKTRVSVLGGDNKITATINGGVRSGSGFYYADYATSDGKSIYISDVCYTEAGTRVSSESITQYSLSGRYEKTVYQKKYEGGNTPLQTGNILSMQMNAGKLTFLFKDENCLSLYQIRDGQTELIRSVSLGDIPYIHHTYYNAATDSILFTTKDGKLYSEKNDAFRLELDWSDSTGESIIWGLAADAAGELYCTDIGSRQIIRLSDGKNVLAGSRPVASGALIYRISCNDSNVLSFTDNDSILLADLSSGHILLDTASVEFCGSYIAVRMLVWICAAFLSLIILSVLVIILSRLIKSKHSIVLKTAVLLGAVIILTTALVTMSILSSTSGRLNKKNLSNLKETAASISANSGKTFGNALESISSLGDYGGANYRTIRSFLDVYCDCAYDNGSNMYYILFKYDDDMLYGVIDYEDTIGTIRPFMEYSGSGYDKAVTNNEVVVVDAEADSYGYWAYAIAPVYNSSGETIGILEIGSDLYGEQLQNRALIKSVVLSTAVLILIILLLLSELTALAQCVSSLNTASGRREVLEFIRPLAFLTFCSESFGAAFTPQLSEKLFASSGLAISSSLGAAFPMSAQLFSVAALALFGGFLIDRLGLKRVILCGFLVQLAGNFLTAFSIPSGSYYLLLAGKTLSGCGMGAAVVSLNAMPTFADGEDRRNSLFSGLNVGLMSGVVFGTAVGSYIAETGGHFITFLASAIVSLAAFFLGLFCLKKGVRAQSPVAEAENSGRGGMPPLKFLVNPVVISFLLFLMLPFLLIMYFRDYLFPLFASGAGYSDAEIGNVLLFGGALSIYLTPVLSKYSMKYLRAKGTAILASLCYAAALILFAVYHTTAMSVLAALIISLAGGVGIISQSVYYSSLGIVNRFGSGKAMGIYSLFDNLGQAAGPLLFGALLIFGYSKASLIIALTALALLLLFIIFNFKKPLRTPEALPQQRTD